MYRFPNPTNNEWIDKYNQLIDDVEAGKLVFECVEGKRNKGLSLHHILPRSIYPELTKDPNNHIYLPFKEHIDLHYYMWKADKKWAHQLWFGCVYGRKHDLWDLPGGEEEYVQLKNDLKKKQN